MPRKKARSLSSDDEYAPSASARRLSIKAKTRQQRQRRVPTAFSPTVNTPVRKVRKVKDVSVGIDGVSSTISTRPEHKRLENKIKSQAHRLRYPLAFVEAYEAEGWRNSSVDKLKPNKELEVERLKIIKGQRAILNGFDELRSLHANHPQVPPTAVFEEVHCSHCGSTDIETDDDILLCDSVGCHRAYHQRCQTPIVMTADIPAGDDPWFCEICLAVFECLKSINSVFGTTYENVEDLFPELSQMENQLNNRDSSSVLSGEENVPVLVNENDEEEDDEDFVCHDEGDDDDDDNDFAEIEEEVATEIPETAQDLLYLSNEDVIDLTHRSSRSKALNQPSKTAQKKAKLIGEPAAKIDRKTGKVILGQVVELEPPVKGRYSRWRIDYRDGTSELLTRSKTQAAINRAVVVVSDDDQNDEGSEAEGALIVRGKRKRNEVDYRQLNELMFAGKDEDSEEDETFEVKAASDDEPDEEENHDDNAQKLENKVAENVSDQSPITVTLPHAASLPLDEKRKYLPRASVNYIALHERQLS